MVSQIQYKNLYLDEVGGKWWSNIAEEDEGVLARTTSGLDNRNGKYWKYYGIAAMLCDAETAWS